MIDGGGGSAPTILPPSVKQHSIKKSPPLRACYTLAGFQNMTCLGSGVSICRLTAPEGKVAALSLFFQHSHTLSSRGSLMRQLRVSAIRLSGTFNPLQEVVVNDDQVGVVLVDGRPCHLPVLHNLNRYGFEYSDNEREWRILPGVYSSSCTHGNNTARLCCEAPSYCRNSDWQGNPFAHILRRRTGGARLCRPCFSSSPPTA